jgi:hypothetical protein
MWSTSVEVARADGMVILLVPGCVPIDYGGCLLRSIQYAGTGAASREGQSSISISKKSIGHEIAKVKLIVFIDDRKSSNTCMNTAQMYTSITPSHGSD